MKVKKEREVEGGGSDTNQWQFIEIQRESGLIRCNNKEYREHKVSVQVTCFMQLIVLCVFNTTKHL